MTWRPTADVSALEARATLVDGLRQFFKARGSLEVEVPALAKAPSSDPWIDSFSVSDPAGQPIGYLLSSPETYLKRLLSQHPRPWHAFTKAYRANESGQQHAIEFSMLEWYRPDASDPYRALIDELTALVASESRFGVPEVVTYRSLFEAAFGLNPHAVEARDLAYPASEWVGPKVAASLDHDSLLNLLFSHGIEPSLENHIVIDFPEIQAALAQVQRSDQGDSVARRAELYMAGVEIANGYHELTDPQEQRTRFDTDRARRAQFHRPIVPTDEALLAALTAGLPDSYGVALGVDRWVMVNIGATELAECMSFWECS